MISKVKLIQISESFLIVLLLTSCQIPLKKNKPPNKLDLNIIEDVNKEKRKMEIRFSCGENGIKKYLEDGWIILEEYSEEKICTWKSFPATKDCDMDKDKGCKITEPDKIGEEKIYLLEKKL